MPKAKPWVMPRWMHNYAGFICNTGGNRIDELMNGNADPRVNLPLSTLQACVKSQVVMLTRMHDAGVLPPPQTAAVLATLRRQRHALESIHNAVIMVSESGQLPKKLRPGMDAIVEAAKRGVGA